MKKHTSTYRFTHSLHLFIIKSTLDKVGPKINAHLLPPLDNKAIQVPHLIIIISGKTYKRFVILYAAPLVSRGL